MRFSLYIADFEDKYSSLGESKSLAVVFARGFIMNIALGLVHLMTRSTSSKILVLLLFMVAESGIVIGLFKIKNLYKTDMLWGGGVTLIGIPFLLI